MRQARALEEGDGGKKLLEHARWHFGEAAEIAASVAATERAMQKRAELLGVKREAGLADVAPPPELLTENQDAWDLYLACRSQLIVGGLGVVVGLSHESIPWKMDLLGIERHLRAEAFDKFQLIEAEFVAACNRAVPKGKQ